jgi:glycosyltransferase involved in cell wall biosynthesis
MNPQRMKIVYVHRTRAQGVEAVHIGQIVQGFRTLGHQVDMLSPVGDYIEHITSAKARQPARQGKPGLLHRLVDRLPEIAFELMEMAYNAKAVWEGLRRFPRRSVDGVYERYAIFALAGMLLARWWKVPFVIEVNYTSMSPLVRERSALLKPLARWVDGRLFRSATHLLAVSSYLKQHLVEEFGVDPGRVSIVPNAADPAVFDPEQALKAEAPALPPGRIIGFVGGFYRWHGLDLLVEAFTRIAAEFPDAHLLLIGDGPMRGEIEALARDKGLTGRVLMPGRIAHAKLVPYVARFDMGVMPDSNLYGSPMKVFEYMSMAVPVVVPDYAPLQDVVTDGQQGRIFRRKDVAHLTQCMAELLRDDTQRRQMGRNARQCVLQTHNWLNNASTSLGFLTSKRSLAS